MPQLIEQDIQLVAQNNAKEISHLKKLEVQEKELTQSITDLNAEFDKRDNQLDGWTKFMGGALWGNKKEVNALNALVDQIKGFETELKKISELKLPFDAKVDQIISHLLNQHSPELGKKVDEINTFQSLLKSASDYLSILESAQRGIKDALMFLSWEKLINHPEATERLKSFKNTTFEFQQKIEEASNNVSGKIEPINIMEMIRFSHQTEGMNSFHQMMKETEHIIKTCKTSIAENIEETALIKSQLRIQLLDSVIE